MNKKAQSELITTVLIILLVLAAIVIVWQVVQKTVTKGGEEVTSQSECLGLSIELAYNSVDKTVNVKPSKKIDGFRVYQGGEQVGSDGAAVNAYETGKSSALAAGTDTKITSAGKIGNQWCEGMEEITVTVAA